MRCDCVNMKHDSRCWQNAKWECEECGDKLCGGCKKNHHNINHTKFKKLDQPPRVESGG